MKFSKVYSWTASVDLDLMKHNGPTAEDELTPQSNSDKLRSDYVFTLACLVHFNKILVLLNSLIRTLFL